MIKPIQERNLPRKRVIIIVLDGAGVGALPDAYLYGDSGANTLEHVLQKQGPLDIPVLYRLGLKNILGQLISTENIIDTEASYGRMAPLSPGKDTTTGHWELSGLVLKKPFPTYPEGFPDKVVWAFEEAIGRKTIGNIAASGTEIINEMGNVHLETGFPIIYTSADSVFQIAAHEDIVPPEQLYDWCSKARRILTGSHAVGRVIARPFTGHAGNFTRTERRKDFSLEPPGLTLLDLTRAKDLPVAVVGKVKDIFAARNVSVYKKGGDNEEVGRDLMDLIKEVPSGLIWANFNDFDTKYGHRNDAAGFAMALEQFDKRLDSILRVLEPGDLLFVTADHGCDPTYPTTDHTREYVPLLVWNCRILKGRDLGTRNSFADLAATAAEWLATEKPDAGCSFMQEILTQG